MSAYDLETIIGLGAGTGGGVLFVVGILVAMFGKAGRR